MGKARLPWKRGPKAWEIACRADLICEQLERTPAQLLSLRRCGRILGISTQPVRELRRGDHSAARLKIEQEPLKQQQDWTEEEAVEFFQRWAKNPAVREQICGNCLNEEEKEDRLREIFGMAPKSRNGDSIPENQTGSD